MIAKDFALGTWEIHLQGQTEKKYILDNMQKVCKYIDTAIDYNNDYLLKDIRNKYKLISKISPYHADNYEFFVSNHLKCLNTDKIDIMLIHSARGNWQKVAKLMSTDNRFTEKGVSNFTSKEIEEYKSITGFYPAYCEIEINPYYIDLETIEFCKTHEIKIIAYGIFGGKYNAVRNIADFSLPYMISFSANYADIIILKPECERHTLEIIDVVKNFEITPSMTFMPIAVNNKAVEPMVYDSSRIFDKTCLSFPTYHNSVGENNSTEYIAVELNEKLPNFEMLGDYMTYIRYKYRSNYDDCNVYKYDFLIGDDKSYYAIYLYDENNKITKINKFGKVKLFNIKMKGKK